MTRDIEVGDFVKVVYGEDMCDRGGWDRTMKKYINDGQSYEVERSSNNDSYIHGYWFPNECLEFYSPIIDQSLEPLPDIPNVRSVVYPKTVYSRIDSHETYDSEKEAMIAHFDEQIKSLVLYRGNFNISTVIENLDELISELNMMKTFDIIMEME